MAKNESRAKDIRFRLEPDKKRFFEWCCVVFEVSQQEAMEQALNLWMSQQINSSGNQSMLNSALNDYAEFIQQFAVEPKVNCFVKLLKEIKEKYKIDDWAVYLQEVGFDARVIADQKLVDTIASVEQGRLPDDWQLSLIQSLDCDLEIDHLQSLLHYELLKINKKQAANHDCLQS